MSEYQAGPVAGPFEPGLSKPCSFLSANRQAKPNRCPLFCFDPPFYLSPPSPQPDPIVSVLGSRLRHTLPLAGLKDDDKSLPRPVRWNLAYFRRLQDQTFRVGCRAGMEHCLYWLGWKRDCLLPLERLSVGYAAFQRMRKCYFALPTRDSSFLPSGLVNFSRVTECRGVRSVR